MFRGFLYVVHSQPQNSSEPGIFEFSTRKSKLDLEQHYEEKENRQNNEENKKEKRKRTGKRKGMGKGKEKGKAQRREETEAGNENDVFCLICGEKYEEPATECWLQCQSCYGWAHELCSDTEHGYFHPSCPHKGFHFAVCMRA
ncbi:hypothetical protein ACJJTC_000407 [Scirpophaga incertulas]